MRPTPPLCFGLLAVSAAALLPAALHAQAIGRGSRSAGPSAPSPSASYPAPSAPGYGGPFARQSAPAPSYSAPQYRQPVPQQFMPLHGSPIYAQPTQGRYSFPGQSSQGAGPIYGQPSQGAGPIYGQPSQGAGRIPGQSSQGGYPNYAQPTQGGYSLPGQPAENGGPAYGQPQQPGGRSYEQQPSPGGRSYGPQFSGRGPGGAASAFPGQSGRRSLPASRTETGSAYQFYGNAPIFGRGSDSNRHRSVRVTTPVGPSALPSNNYYPIYSGPSAYNYGGGYGSGVTVIGQPTFLGGYYYGGYCDTSYGVNTYPSVYSTYSGFPNYIYSPASVIVLSDPYSPAYVTGYQPFYTPSYPVVYNQNIYYVGSQERAQQITGDDETARKAALRNAYPEGSFQAAFGDIERAWLDGNVNALQKHLRGGDVKLSVFFKGKYSYSIATSDYVQITRDAFDKISTVSFKFDRLRKAKNGDVTAYGTHVYRGSVGGDGASTDSTVPFSTDSSAITSDNTSGAAPGVEKTASVAYTVRHQDGQWNIVAIDSSPAGGAK